MEESTLLDDYTDDDTIYLNEEGGSRTISASKVMTSWRYTYVFVISISIITSRKLATLVFGLNDWPALCAGPARAYWPATQLSANRSSYYYNIDY